MAFPENGSGHCGVSPSINGNADSKLIIPDSHPSSEGSNAKRKPGSGKSSVVKRKPGRKRGGRSMGRFPFLALANKYLEAYGANYAEATRKEYDRRYRRMNKDITMLVRILSSTVDRAKFH